MEESVRERLGQAIGKAKAQYYRLVLLVGQSRTGKTETLRAVAHDFDCSVVNLNLALTERLLELTKKQRALRVQRILSEELDAVEDGAVMLDNIEVLFDPDLSQDPLRLLQGMARNRTVASTWPGAFDGTNLTYAEPGHPEWRRYVRPEAVIVAIGGDQAPRLSGTKDSVRAQAQEER